MFQTLNRPAQLEAQDFFVLRQIVRSTVPKSFADGRGLVILDNKLTAVLEAYEQTRINAAVERKLAEKEKATKQNGNDVPSSA